MPECGDVPGAPAEAPETLREGELCWWWWWWCGFEGRREVVAVVVEVVVVGGAEDAPARERSLRAEEAERFVGMPFTGPADSSCE